MELPLTQQEHPFVEQCAQTPLGLNRARALIGTDIHFLPAPSSHFPPYCFKTPWERGSKKGQTGEFSQPDSGCCERRAWISNAIGCSLESGGSSDINEC